MKNKKLHITLTEQEFNELNEMKTYFASMLSKHDITIPMSYSWVIGSSIRKCYDLYFKQKD